MQLLTWKLWKMVFEFGRVARTNQKEDFDQAAVHFLHFALPPGPLPLCLDYLADL